MAYYRKKDWNRFLEIIDDRDGMPHTWEDWHKKYLKAKLGLIKEGYIVLDLTIDLDDLIKYCAKMGIKNDGKARSQYASRGGIYE